MRKETSSTSVRYSGAAGLLVRACGEAGTKAVKTPPGFLTGAHCAAPECQRSSGCVAVYQEDGPRTLTVSAPNRARLSMSPELISSLLPSFRKVNLIAPCSPPEVSSSLHPGMAQICCPGPDARAAGFCLVSKAEDGVGRGTSPGIGFHLIHTGQVAAVRASWSGCL